MPVSLDDIAQFLGCDTVTENLRKQSAGNMEWTMVDYTITPPNPEGGSLTIIFDESREYVQCVGWRSWHAHFDSHDNEQVNVRNALRFMRNVMRQRYVLVEFADKQRGYMGSGVERAYDFQKFLIDNRELYTDCSKSNSIDHYRISQFNVGCAIISESND